jgi:hypothetical protein
LTHWNKNHHCWNRDFSPPIYSYCNLSWVLFCDNLNFHGEGQSKHSSYSVLGGMVFNATVSNISVMSLYSRSDFRQMVSIWVVYWDKGFIFKFNFDCHDPIISILKFLFTFSLNKQATLYRFPWTFIAKYLGLSVEREKNPDSMSRYIDDNCTFVKPG